MYAEKLERYPKGTYKVLISLHLSSPNTVAGFRLVNLATGYQVRSNAVWDLVQAIEDDIMAAKFPQSATRYRTWGAGPTPVARRLGTGGGQAADEQSESTRILTFIVRVLYSQNATWQGSVQWLEGKQARQYRSVNELLRLMGEAVELTGTSNPQDED